MLCSPTSLSQSVEQTGIQRIFNARRISKTVITNQILFFRMAVLLSIHVAALTLSVLLGFQSRSEVVQNLEISSSGNYLEVKQCTKNRFAVWWSFLFIGSQLVWGAQMAFSVRQVPSAFNESHHIMFAVSGPSKRSLCTLPIVCCCCYIYIYILLFVSFFYFHSISFIHPT